MFKLIVNKRYVCRGTKAELEETIECLKRRFPDVTVEIVPVQ